MQASAVQGQGSIPVREYEPDGGFALSGVLLMAGVLVVAGVVLGVAGHYISRLIWLIVLFPAGIGLAMGAIASGMVRVGRVRSPFMAGFLGLLAGFAAMFVMHYQQYEQFRSLTSGFTQELRQIAQLPEAQRKERIAQDLTPEERAEAEKLLELAAINDMLDFMNWRAREGVRIGKPGSGDSGINLGFTGSWIYWAIEVLIVAGITYAMAKSAAEKPYCVACDQWKPYRLLGCFTGPPDRVHVAVSEGSVAELRGLGPVGGLTDLALHVAQCPRCGVRGDADLKLELTTVNGKGEKATRVLVQRTTPGSAMALVEPLFAASPATAAAPAASDAAPAADAPAPPDVPSAT